MSTNHNKKWVNAKSYKYLLEWALGRIYWDRGWVQSRIPVTFISVEVGFLLEQGILEIPKPSLMSFEVKK